MVRKDLENLRALRHELYTLETKYTVMPKTESLGDTYGDYRTGKKITKIIYGKSSARADALRQRIDKKAAAIKEMILEMELFLDEVEDSEIRDILRLYYAKGLSQSEIAELKGYSREAITKKLKRFWNKR